ncbi:MAG: phasin family protein [Kiloniellales bacterium]
MSSKKTTFEAETGAEEAKLAAKTASAVVEEAAEESADVVGDAVAMAEADVKKLQAVSANGYEDLVDLQKDNFEAAVRAGTIVAKGYEAIGKEMMAFTQAALEANLAAVQAVLGAATLREAVDLQRDHLRKTLDEAVAEGGKLGEMSVKLASEAIAPIQARMNATVEHFVKPMAA